MTLNSFSNLSVNDGFLNLWWLEVSFSLDLPQKLTDNPRETEERSASYRVVAALPFVLFPVLITL